MYILFDVIEAPIPPQPEQHNQAIEANSTYHIKSPEKLKLANHKSSM